MQAHLAPCHGIPALLPCQNGSLVRSAFDEHERALLDDVLRLLVVRVAADAVSGGQPIMQYTRQGQAQGELSLMQRLLAMIKWMAQASVVPEEGDKAKGVATDKAQGGRAGEAQDPPPQACCLLFVRRGLGCTGGFCWGQEGAHVDTIKGRALAPLLGLGSDTLAAAAAASKLPPWLCCSPPAPSPQAPPVCLTWPPTASCWRTCWSWAPSATARMCLHALRQTWR